LVKILLFYELTVETLVHLEKNRLFNCPVLTEIVSRTFHLKTGLSGQKPDVATQMEDDEYDPRQLQVP